MMPLGDDNSENRGFAVVNYALIAVCVFVFLVPQRAGMPEGAPFTVSWSLVPEEIVTGKDLVRPAETRQLKHKNRVMDVEDPGLGATPSVYLTPFTSMFMHGSIMHLLGNMLFLWIFGDNIESRFGSARYLGFYLLGGLAAGGAHVAAVYAFRGDPRVPCLGASGAISAVMGAYMLLFPANRVKVLIFRFITEVPAIVAVGLWFVMQVVSASYDSDGSGGVAYGAHIGGFIAGLPLALFFCTQTPPGAGFGDSPHE